MSAMADAPAHRPTGADWVARFAAELGIEAPDERTVETLLDLAGAAAHASERIAAPIACYLVGKAGLEPDDALALASTLVPGDGAS
jgi:hypothetical protein